MSANGSEKLIALILGCLLHTGMHQDINRNFASKKILQFLFETYET